MRDFETLDSEQSSGISFENVSENLNGIFMVPTAKEVLFSRTSSGHNYHIPGQSIQDLR